MTVINKFLLLICVLLSPLFEELNMIELLHSWVKFSASITHVTQVLSTERIKV